MQGKHYRDRARLQHLYECCTGSIDSSWDGLGAYFNTLDGAYLGNLTLDGNILAGVLPVSWATTWRNVPAISLANTSLTANLLESWGTGGGFPSLKNLTLDDNPGLKGVSACTYRSASMLCAHTPMLNAPKERHTLLQCDILCMLAHDELLLHLPYRVS